MCVNSVVMAQISIILLQISLLTAFAGASPGAFADSISSF